MSDKVNYKDTLNLPKTDFSMKADLVKREPERLAKWEAARLYEQIQDSRKDAELFVLHDGPPFANGDVHMGTALNKILKDLVVKSRTMLGFRAPFVPGWDCHGLPIEFKVVKESRGLSPLAVRQKSEAYARKFIDIQRAQFKRLGVFGDWENPYLTLDPGYEAEIIRAFATFVEKGLVYQSKKPVYWSTGAQTALAEAEVEYADREDAAIFVKFPIVSGELAGQASMVIWTTTPWTLPANVAIALHPRHDYVVAHFRAPGSERIDQFVIASALIPAFTETTGHTLVVRGRSFRGEALAGVEAQHPFLDRKSRIITAEFVTMDSGTGQVHIAPGHGADDYLAGVQNGLPILSPVDEHGKFTEEVGVPVWAGKYVFDANKDVIEHLRDRGMLLGEQIYKHSYPHCWRSKTPIVFRAVEQFFISIDKVRAEALKAIDGVNWIPAWGRNRIFGTVESRPDWCISRQRSWGVPLPVFYKKDGTPILRPDWIRKIADLVEKEGTNVWFELSDAELMARLDLPADEIWSDPVPRNAPVITSKKELKEELQKVIEKAIAGGLKKSEIAHAIRPQAAREILRTLVRRNDTLDVWIDSGVSHTAVVAKRPELGGPDRVADVYLEATDQHRGWFQSSLMTSIAMHNRAPYRTVITHGFVVDKDTRKKVSKSEQGTYVKPMNAEHFVGKYGADIVRLWASSVEFTNEVPFSEESFAVLTDAYRSFRNILRILLANLSDFEHAPVGTALRAVRQDIDAGSVLNEKSTPGERLGEASLPANLDGATDIDRWVLSRLQSVIAACREAYASYDFRKVFQTLNQFVTVDISALYVDITKDRLYCDATGSPRRRATQTVMTRVFDSLARLLAPVLVFTADEAWEFFGKKTSVHLETFPEADAALIDRALEERVQKLLDLRAVIAQAIEPARQAKQIGNALEGSVTLQLSDASLLGSLSGRESDLEEFFIISELKLVGGSENKATVELVKHKKCARCWRHRRAVGLSIAHPDLCDRCEQVFAAK